MNAFKKRRILFPFAVMVVAASGFVVVSQTSSFIAGSSSHYVKSLCGNQNSFFSTSPLYKSEKLRFTSNARAFNVNTDEFGKFRVVTNTAPDPNDPKISNLTLEFKDFSTDFKKGTWKVSLSSPGLQTRDFNLDFSKLDNQRSPSFSFRENLGDHTDAKYTLSVKDGNKCVAILPDVFNLSDYNQTFSQELTTMKVAERESGSIRVEKGLSLIGFSDFRSLKPFTDAGMSIFRYDGNGKKWIVNPRDEKFVAQPGSGYFIYNPADSTRVNLGDPFVVAPGISDHPLRDGWNLVYNDAGRDVKLEDLSYTVTGSSQSNRIFKSPKISLKTLIDQGFVLDQIYLASSDMSSSYYKGENASFNKYIRDKGRIPDGAYFWLYLNKEPSGIELDPPSIVLSVDASKTKVKAGSWLFLDIAVKNTDPEPLFVSPSGSDDFCQYGIIVMKDGRTIKDDRNRACPLWFAQQEVSPGAKIDYNYSWKIPGDLKGKYTVRTYFDYTRLKSPDMLYNDIEIEVE